MSYLFLIIFAIFIIVLAGHFFVKAILDISIHFCVSPVILSTTIIAICTAIPDLFVSSVSSYNGFSEIAVASIFSSLIANILLCIGLASVVNCFVRNKQKITYNEDSVLQFSVLFNVIFVIIFVAFLFLLKGEVNFWLSMFLLLGVFMFFFVQIRCYSSNESATCMHDFSRISEIDKIPIKFNKLINSKIFSIFILLFATITMIVFSDIIVYNVVKASDYFLIPKKVIAVFFLGIGHSIPEIVTTIIATIKRKPEIAIGNIVGSNIIILGGVLSSSSLIYSTFNEGSQKLALPMLMIDIPFFIIATMAFFLIFKIKSNFNIFIGLIFLFLYLLYILLQLNIM